MKLKKFKKIIDKTVKQAEETDPDIKFHIGEHVFDVDRIGQFGVVPDVVVDLSYSHSYNEEEYIVLKDCNVNKNS